MILPKLHRGSSWPSQWGRHVLLTAATLMFCPLLTGCAALTNPVARGIPVHDLPPELLSKPRDPEESIPLSLLGQVPPDTYQLAAGDVLGVWIEAVLGDRNVSLPVHVAPQVQTHEQRRLPPAVGYPITVDENGTVTLPLVGAVDVRGMSTAQAREAIRKVYTSKQLLPAGRELIFVTLLQPRQYHVVVLRQESATFVGPESLVGSSKRGTGHVIDLPAYENDVLHALARPRCRRRQERRGPPWLDEVSMNEQRLARLVAYGVAVLATAVSLLIRWPLWPALGDAVPHMTFFPAVMVAAYFGGFRPGLLATILSAVAANSFLTKQLPYLQVTSVNDVTALILFVLTGVVISGLCESLHRSQHRIAASERRYAVTLASIGDAVIATDTQARVTFVNPAAAELTGWPLVDAVGRPLAEVFRIVHEQTRQPVEDPAAKVLRTGTVVGLANHTALLARDGREVPIDDCGAPILDDRGAIAGVVLVFRDVTQRRRAEEAEAFRRANERMEQALRGSSVGMWEVEMPDGDFHNGRRYYLNLWEQLGFGSSPLRLRCGSAA